MPWSSDDDSEVLTFLPADQLNQWDLTAKFSVSTAEGTESGSIRWIVNSDEERLDILSPTGSVVAQLTITGIEARLKTDDRETIAKEGNAFALKYHKSSDRIDEILIKNFISNLENLNV